MSGASVLRVYTPKSLIISLRSIVAFAALLLFLSGAIIKKLREWGNWDLKRLCESEINFFPRNGKPGEETSWTDLKFNKEVRGASKKEVLDTVASRDGNILLSQYWIRYWKREEIHMEIHRLLKRFLFQSLKSWNIFLLVYIHCSFP